MCGRRLRVALILATILTVVSMGGGSWAAEVNGHRETRFSPEGGCTELLVKTIDNARHDIRALVYSCTSKPIAAALIRAQERGVVVRVVSDRVNLKGKGSVTPQLEAAGIEVKYDLVHKIMHDKVGVFDGSVVATGSFNWTEAAERSNAENLNVIWDAAWAQDLLAEWGKLEAVSVPRAEAETRIGNPF
jgi:phosphatidylserine/phosphatidylglycerophosphate/cardiolipin synthase-like enzyme